MKEQYIVAEYENYEKAQIGLQVLDKRGFTDDSVTVVLHKEAIEIVELEKARRERQTRVSAAASGGIGAAVASGAAAPIAIGTMLGPFFLIGPLAAAVAGAAAGGLVGGTKNWWVNEDLKRSYHERVEDGSILVVVHASGDRLLDAESGLRTTDTLSLETYCDPD